MHTSNTDHDETLKDFRIAINQLVDDDNMPEVLTLIEKDRERAVREARLDELKHLWNSTQSYIVPDGVEANDMSEALHKRIEKLRSKL